MIQGMNNDDLETAHKPHLIEPHLQDFKSKKDSSSGPNNSDDRKTSSYESCRGLLNGSNEFKSARQYDTNY